MKIFAGICLYLLRMDRWMDRLRKPEKWPGACQKKKIIPQFRIPVSIGLDNGLAFVAEVVQLGAKALVILGSCTRLPPPEFRKIEHMNRTL
jgi:hypothetical protein